MPKIDEIKFGSIVVRGKRYRQIIISGDQAEERDEERLEGQFGTTHRVGEWEVEALLEGNPRYIIIGTGFDGAMEVEEEVLQKLQNSGAEILVLHSPIAASKYNELVAKGEKVNILIHTTC